MKNTGGREPREDEKCRSVFHRELFDNRRESDRFRVPQIAAARFNVSHTYGARLDTSDLHATNSFGGKGNIQFTSECGRIIRVGFVTRMFGNIARYFSPDVRPEKFNKCKLRYYFEGKIGTPFSP